MPEIFLCERATEIRLIEKHRKWQNLSKIAANQHWVKPDTPAAASDRRAVGSTACPPRPGQLTKCKPLNSRVTHSTRYVLNQNSEGFISSYKKEKKEIKWM